MCFSGFLSLFFLVVFWTQKKYMTLRIFLQLHFIYRSSFISFILHAFLGVCFRCFACGFAVPQTQKTRCTCIDACNCKHPYPCTTDVVLQKKVWSCGLSPLNPASLGLGVIGQIYLGSKQPNPGGLAAVQIMSYPLLELVRAGLASFASSPSRRSIPN